MKHKKLNRAEKKRREFLRSTFLATAITGVSLVGLYPTLTKSKIRLRPPGALEEQLFLASCIKCGQCVQVCPVEAIFLADIFDGQGLGAPYIDARAQACDFSCDGLQCVLACPTGSLTHDLNYVPDTKMGLARLANPKTCLAVAGKGFKGKVREEGYRGVLRFDEIDRWNPLELNSQNYDLEICDLCVRLCPIEIRRKQCKDGNPPQGDDNQCPPKSAIRLEKRDNNKYVPVVLEGCVGCGVCEMVCPTEEASIVIDARVQWSNK
jgi:ferredoxin-type protein NapG